MSMYVPQTFQVTYQNNIEMKLQQSKSLLQDAVTTTDDNSGDKVKVVDIAGSAMPQEADERHGDTKYANTPHDGIWLPKKPELYYAELVDNADKLSTGINLEGIYVNEGAAVINRAKDRRILEGIYGNVISGRDGTVVTPFPATMIVPAATGGASGAQRMNVAKVRAATKLMAKAFVDLTEPRFMALTAEQMDDLLSEIPVVNADFKAAFGGQVNEEGQITRLLGWNLIPMELSNPFLGTVAALSVDSNGYRKTPFWVKSGVRVNFWQRLRTSLDPIPTKVLSRQVFAGTTLAATRTQDGKVGYIENSEL
jgi:hypothetical protein